MAKPASDDGAAWDSFGHAVSLSGDMLAVGAHRNDGSKGAVYLFKRNNGGIGAWGQVAKFFKPPIASVMPISSTVSRSAASRRSVCSAVPSVMRTQPTQP